MSKDLKKRGFRFVGSTICYAFMQAVGMVNDHEVGCFRYGDYEAFWIVARLAALDEYLTWRKGIVSVTLRRISRSS